MINMLVSFPRMIRLRLTVVLSVLILDCKLDPLVFKALVRLLIDTATDELFVVTVPVKEVIEDAREELLVFMELPRVVIELANEDEAFTTVLFVVVRDAAIDELFVLILLARPSILRAAEPLLLVTVPLSEVTEEFNDADAILKEELIVVT